MSDAPNGPGWWQASDHRWYPPEVHPNYQLPQPPLGFTMPKHEDPFSIAPAGWVAVGSTVAMVVGTFLPWATIGIFSISGIDTGDGKAFIVMALIAVVLASTQRRSTARWVLNLVLGGLCVALAVYEVVDLSTTGDEFVSVGTGSGLWICLLASIGYVSATVVTRSSMKPR